MKVSIPRALIALLLAACLGGCSDDTENPTQDGPVVQSDAPVVVDSGQPTGEGGAPDGSSPDSKPVPAICDPECYNFYDWLCVKDTANNNTCESCLNDSHCQGNPRSDGPTCDTVNKMCVCNGDDDCAGWTTGIRCLQVGNFKMCTCDTDADCVAPHTLCIGMVVKRCKKPCTSNDDCQEGGMIGTCDTATGKCEYPEI